MRAPLSWLSEYADAGLPADALAERLAMTGTEVDRVLHHGVGAVDAFVVGQVEAVEPHPDADRLRVCRVDVGEAEPAQIVCGAPNVAAGQTVAVARPGAVMPDGTKLKAAKLRGVRSEGMILAEDELAIGTDHSGIIVLDANGTRPGTPLTELLAVADDVLELEITPNRPDCLSIYGVAREVHAATLAPLAEPPWADDPGSSGPVEGAEVVVECPDLCPRFTARVFEDVTIGPSPPWLKARLTAAGMRPISNVVDITNYAMLLTGHPLHAFDLDRVAGRRLVVRRAAEGETVDTLDGSTRTLDGDMVLIADDDGPTSIAGVMGGARSEVADDTTRVLLEVAVWDGPNINRTSNALALRSEASGRFEKGLQPESTLEAQAVATKLMLELTGARLAPGTIDVADRKGTDPSRSRTLPLRDARVSGLLGVDVERSTSRRVLEALGFGVEDAPDGLSVTVPYWRRDDVTREADLVEEVSRLAVLQDLPATLPTRASRGAVPPELLRRRRIADALRDRGLSEIVGWSFVAPDLFDRLRLGEDDARRQAVRLENPMSEEHALLRTTLVGSLLDTARHNVARGAGRVALFEQGAVYLPRTAGDDSAEAAAGLPRERQHLAGILLGPVRPASWGDPEPPAAGFFAAKGIVEALLEVLRVDVTWERAGEPYLHPGRTARAGELGVVGELHPRVAAAWDLPGGAYFELDLEALPPAAPEAFAEVPTHPAVRQDLAIVVHDDVTAARVLAVARGASKRLADAGVFDIYRGERIGEGRTSLALHLEFRAPDRTLTEAEASAERERIVAALKDELGAEPRG